jgi:hypothetical protein
MCDEKNKEDEQMSTNTVLDAPSPAKSLEQSLKEMKKIREGKMEKKSWKAFLDELENEKE